MNLIEIGKFNTFHVGVCSLIIALSFSLLLFYIGSRIYPLILGFMPIIFVIVAGCFLFYWGSVSLKKSFFVSCLGLATLAFFSLLIHQYKIEPFQFGFVVFKFCWYLSLFLGIGSLCTGYIYHLLKVSKVIGVIVLILMIVVSMSIAYIFSPPEFVWWGFKLSYVILVLWVLMGFYRFFQIYKPI